AHRAIAIERTPELTVAQEEPLNSGVSVQYRRGLPAKRDAISLERYGEARQIADVLAHGQLPVHMQAGQGLELVILFAQLAHARFDVLAVRVCPPIVEHAVSVDLRTLVVIAVAQF